MRLRNRLFVGLGAIVVVFGIIGLLIANTQRKYLVEQVDRRLESSVGLAAGIFNDRPIPLPPEGAADLTELWVGNLAPDGTLTPVVEGQLVSGSPGVTLDDALRHANRPGRGEPFTVDGFRVIAVTRPDQQGWSIVALSLEATDAAYVRLLWALGLGALVVLTVVVLIGLWVLRLGVKPITEVTAAAEAIGSGERDRRVPSFPAGTEAAELSDAFNAMIDEKEAADERLRQFVADASHELRTPLTSIRGYADLYQRGGLSEPARLDDAMRRVTGEAERMGALVDDLLLLSKLDRGLPIEHVTVDLASLLDDAAADARAVQPDRPITVQCVRPLTCKGDPLRLHQVVAALVHNALVHTPATTAVELIGAPSDGAAVLDVVDHGEGLDPEAAAKVFERFYRGDPSRARSSGGSGLGLSIAKSIVETHGGRITVHTAPGEGCRFRVAVPSSD